MNDEPEEESEDCVVLGDTLLTNDEDNGGSEDEEAEDSDDDDNKGDDDDEDDAGDDEDDAGENEDSESEELEKEEDSESEELEKEEESAEDDYEPTLAELEDEFKDLKNTVVTLEVKLGIATMGGKIASEQVVYQIKSSLASANGQLDDLQFELDSMDLPTKEDKLKRKNLNNEIDSLSEKLYIVFEKCDDAIKNIADAEKTAGNEHFKQGNYAKAIQHYTSAIGIDSTNAVFHTNRALAHQKLNDHPKAISDAKVARTLDVNYLKAYVILTKSCLATGDIDGAKETLDAVPIASQQKPDVADLRAQTSAAAKEAGNDLFKRGQLDAAIKMYSTAILCQPDNHVLYSNRSAAFQSKSLWTQALADAEKCVQICETFHKGWLHMGRCQIRLECWTDAETTVNLAKMLLSAADDYDKIEPQLNEIAMSASAGKKSKPSPLQFKPSEPGGASASSNAIKAEQFKDRGNSYYKQEEYQDAIRFYTQAISLCPTDGSYYGNRAAAWVMLKEYKRAVQDCVDGTSQEKSAGQYDKLRQRQANALAAMGQREKAITFLEESLQSLKRVVTDHVQALEDQLKKFRAADALITSANESLEKKEFSRAKRLFQNAQAEGLTDDPAVLLGVAKACLGLEEFEDASRFSQKAISSGGSSVSIETYLVRADALQATGCTDLAQKHLTVALQMDPDNSAVQLKLKKIRRNVTETARVRASVQEAMNARNYELAITRCGEGFQIDKDAKKLIAEFHEKRAKAYSMLAKQQARSTGHKDAEDSQSSPAALSRASWQKCLHDAHSSLYYNSSASDTLPVILLKCEALQALEKFQEAVDELEQCYKNGPGEGDPSVRSKFQDAQRLLKKSKRVDLYKVLGCTRGELSSEKEIKTCYKKAALQWHPDRHSRGGEEAKKAAEKTFKEIGDAYELLMDPQRRQLYDKGYDREEIEQQMEMQKQQQQGGGHNHYGGGHHGHYH